MKIRNGFVSNSSSTSFTVAYKPAKACPTCGHAYDLTDIVNKAYDSEISCSGFDEVLDEVKDSAIYAGLPVEDEEQAMQALKNKGFDFLKFTVSHHDAEFDKTLEAMVKLGTVIVLNECDC